MSIHHLANNISQLETIAIAAGDIIMRHREKGLSPQHKSDDSPVTAADREADAYICEQLCRITPDIPIVSEEGAHVQAAAADGRFWCVDPLDGTKGFIRGGKNFTVNIALIDKFQPVIGVIYVPVPRMSYAGIVGQGATRRVAGEDAQPVAPRALPDDGLTAMVSHMHGSDKEAEIKDAFGIINMIPASSSLKFCRLIEGVADIYPRFGPTMEWDTAAGHALMRAVGGDIIDMETNTSLAYAKAGFLNGGFVARTHHSHK